MSSSRVKTRELKSGVIAYSESAIRNNASAVEYCRTSMAALSGSTAATTERSKCVVSYDQVAHHQSVQLPIWNCQYPTYVRTKIMKNYDPTVLADKCIMGLTGIIGFLFYLVAVLGLWCMLLLKSGSNWQKYFISRRSLLINGFMGGLCTYVLFWTFLFGMVHVY